MKSIFYVFTGLFLTISLGSIVLSQNNSKPDEQRISDAEQQLFEYYKIQELNKRQQLNYRNQTLNKAGIFIEKNDISSSTIFFYDNFETIIHNWTTIAYSGHDLWHRTNRDAASQSTSYWCG